MFAAVALLFISIVSLISVDVIDNGQLHQACRILIKYLLHKLQAYKQQYPVSQVLIWVIELLQSEHFCHGANSHLILMARQKTDYVLDGIWQYLLPWHHF